MKKNGFTLVELLVAITIFSIIAGITVKTGASVQKAARDAQRQADLSTIKSALEQYHSDQGFYPSSLTGFGGDRTMSLDDMEAVGLTACSGRPGVCDEFTARRYLDPVPLEPRGIITTPPYADNHYCYEAWRDRNMSAHCNNSAGDRCQYFRVYSRLEIPPTSTTYVCTEPSGGHPGQNFFLES